MKKIKINIPASWNELKDQQLEQIALIFNTLQPGVLFDVAILRILINNEGKLNTLLQEVPLSVLRGYYSSLYTDANRTAFVKQWKINGNVYHSPGDRINNLTIDEFAIVEDLQMKWLKEKDRTYLEYMAAVLYVPKFGKRPDFDKLLLEEKAKEFKEVPIEKLLAMEIAFRGCKFHMEKRFPLVYPKRVGKKKSKADNYGFSKVILQMSGLKFGTHEETKRTNVYTFHEEFQENLKQAENAKRNS
ncbi:hypothetical protein [Flavobacterium beibuense]|uniref:hypothetical protein n=1 Tax=Flavobacterium beibuense TaxID=657326 RepID=UPI003A8D7F31